MCAAAFAAAFPVLFKAQALNFWCRCETLCALAGIML